MNSLFSALRVSPFRSSRLLRRGGCAPQWCAMGVFPIAIGLGHAVMCVLIPRWRLKGHPRDPKSYDSGMFRQRIWRGPVAAPVSEAGCPQKAQPDDWAPTTHGVCGRIELRPELARPIVASTYAPA